LKKVKKAVAQTGVNKVCLAGGVSANSGLRNGLQAMGIKHGWKTFVPSLEYCTDNAAMIAMTAYYKYQQQDFIALDSHPTARAEW